MAIRFLALRLSIEDDPNRSLDKETTIGTPHRETTGFPRTCAGFSVLRQLSGWLFSELLQGRLYPLVWWRVALQRLLYPFWYRDVYPSLQISKLWVREPLFFESSSAFPSSTLFSSPVFELWVSPDTRCENNSQYRNRIREDSIANMGLLQRVVKNESMKKLVYFPSPECALLT